MPRHNLIGEKCKIRKRGSSPSSSASSLLQNYRFKRALLINKRGGSSTPVPQWRISSRYPASFLRMPESPNHPPLHSVGGRKGKQQAPVSARKLAATLWEMNEINSVRMTGYSDHRVKKESRSRERMARSSIQSGYLPQHLSDPSHSPVSERLEGSGIGSHYGRASNLSQKIRHHARKIGGFESISNASFMEIEARSRRATHTDSILGGKTHLRELNSGLTTSKELLAVLGRVWGLEQHYSTGKSIVSALQLELERACERLHHIVLEQDSTHKEKYLMKRIAEEKAIWKRKLHEKIETAVKSILKDLASEKKSRQRSEILTRTLGRELAETKAVLSKVVKKLESEKRTRQIIEQVGDDLARGIGEDKALVEQLRKESAKVREEVEKEREMLHVADLLREERVQMKLLEAKHQYEEKNAAVEKLRSELEAFLRSKGGTVEEQVGKGKGEREDSEDDSSESDLHSIELNMESNNKNYMWNYAAGSTQEDGNRVSVEKEIKGRKSTSGKIGRGRKSLERCTSDGTEWGDGHEQGRGKKTELERQRSKSIKDLRDYIWSHSRLAPTHGYDSPKRQWGEL